MQRIVRGLLVSTTVIATPVVGATMALAAPAGTETHTVRAHPIDAAGGLCGNTADLVGVINPAFGQRC
ncbi:chaplin family protein [Embleya sp. NPDC020886]|uniref:chaplin family protein n=1 Tax=Embleya sp. NPDC020886 TaxID=3363980 RepID=UPI0037B35613